MKGNVLMDGFNPKDESWAQPPMNKIDQEMNLIVPKGKGKRKGKVRW